MHPLKQQGAALITAIFIVAITAVLATAMVLTLRGFIAQSELIKTNDTLSLDVQGVQDWAISMIKQYALDPKKVIKMGARADTAMFKLNIKVNSADVSAKVFDAQSLFNLNNLRYTQYQPNLMRLLQTVSPALKEGVAHQVAVELTQRLLNKKIGPLSTAEALRAMPNVNAKLMQNLLPYVIALPLAQKQVLPLDINAASIPVLMSLSPSVTQEKATALVACRKNHGWFFDVAQYQALCMKPLGLSSLNVSAQTNYFLLRVKAKQDDMRLQLTSLLKLEIVNKQPLVKIIWQSLG